jgi:hypothetical protein
MLFTVRSTSLAFCPRCHWLQLSLILALSLPADESRPIGFETASVKILRRVKLGSGLCFTEMTQFNFGRTAATIWVPFDHGLNFAAVGVA